MTRGGQSLDGRTEDGVGAKYVINECDHSCSSLCTQSLLWFAFYPLTTLHTSITGECIIGLLGASPKRDDTFQRCGSPTVRPDMR